MTQVPPRSLKQDSIQPFTIFTYHQTHPFTESNSSLSKHSPHPLLLSTPYTQPPFTTPNFRPPPTEILPEQRSSQSWKSCREYNRTSIIPDRPSLQMKHAKLHSCPHPPAYSYHSIASVIPHMCSHIGRTLTCSVHIHHGILNPRASKMARDFLHLSRGGGRGALSILGYPHYALQSRRRVPAFGIHNVNVDFLHRRVGCEQLTCISRDIEYRWLWAMCL